MDKKVIVLQQVRDFSQLFGDMITFFGQNWKRLFYLILIYAGPFLLIDGVVTAYSNKFLYSSNSLMYGGYYGYEEGMEFLSKLLLWYGVLILVKVIGYTFITTITYGYISCYAEKGPHFDLNEVRPLALSYFFPVLGASFVIVLMVMIGVVFCIVPGIYLGICLSFVFAIMMIEKRGFGYAFSRSFHLAHKDFWWTLLILLAVGFAVGTIGFIISLPMTGSNMMMVFNRAVGDTVSEGQSVFNMILTTATTVIMSFMMVFQMIAICLQYFNITETEKRVQPMPGQTV